MARRHVDYGRGSHTIDLRPHEWDPRELAAKVSAIFASPAYVPPSLPQVAMEILALSSQPDVDLHRIVRLMERDPVIAGRILKIANSPTYRGSAPTRTMKSATQRLGLQMLRDLILAEAMTMKIFRAGSGYADALEELRVHSIMVAHLTRIVCERSAFNAEYAFLCGLLHDIGFAAILLAMGSTGRGEQLTPLDVLWPVAEEAHAAVGAHLARLWGLPDDVVLVIGHHGTARIKGRVHPMLAALLVAEELALASGVGLLPKLPDGVVLFDIDPVHPAELATAQEVLRIDESQMERLREEAEHLVAATSQHV